MSVYDPGGDKRHVTFLLNSELSLNDIEVVKMKIVNNKRGKENSKIISSALKTKTLAYEDSTSNFYIHPIKSPDNMRTER